jgi:hypothetical protein
MAPFALLKFLVAACDFCEALAPLGVLAALRQQAEAGAEWMLDEVGIDVATPRGVSLHDGHGECDGSTWLLSPLLPDEVVSRCGSPFTETWLRWNGGTVRAIAQGILQSREYEALPILPATLEEAGYTDARILRLLRESMQHDSRCWALRLLLALEPG